MNGEWGKAFVRRAMLGFSERVSAMIAPSEKTKNLLEEYGITCPIYVVPSGIELSEYAGDKEAACRERIRAEFSVSSGTTLLLYGGKAGKRETHRGASAFPETCPGKADGAADCRRRSAPERTGETGPAAGNREKRDFHRHDSS